MLIPRNRQALRVTMSLMSVAFLLTAGAVLLQTSGRIASFPFMVAFEWLGPVVELFGYLFMAFAWIFGLVSWEAFAIFLFVAVGLGILLSFSGLLLEEMAFHLYPRLSQIALLAGVAVLENLGYRQINSWWRLLGLWRWATQREARWGEMKRKGLSQGT